MPLSSFVSGVLASEGYERGLAVEKELSYFVMGRGLRKGMERPNAMRRGRVRVRREKGCGRGAERRRGRRSMADAGEDEVEG